MQKLKYTHRKQSNGAIKVNVYTPFEVYKKQIDSFLSKLIITNNKL